MPVAGERSISSRPREKRGRPGRGFGLRAALFVALVVCLEGTAGGLLVASAQSKGRAQDPSLSVHDVHRSPIVRSAQARPFVH